MPTQIHSTPSTPRNARLQALTEAVRNGTYRPDPGAIARAMLQHAGATEPTAPEPDDVELADWPCGRAR